MAPSPSAGLDVFSVTVGNAFTAMIARIVLGAMIWRVPRLERRKREDGSSSALSWAQRL